MADQIVLNAYELLEPQKIQLSRRFYRVHRVDGGAPVFADDHPALINLLWSVRRANRSWGYGAPSFAAEDVIALPTGWLFNDGTVGGQYTLTFESERVVSPANPGDDKLLFPLMSKAVKKRLMDGPGEALGDLWRHYSRLVQMPDLPDATRGSPVFCRAFDVEFKRIGGKPLLTVAISSCAIDPMPISDYYRTGEVGDLADILEAKRNRRTKRDGRPLDINTWCAAPGGGATVVQLADPDRLIQDRALPRAEQVRAASAPIPGLVFNEPRRDYPSTSLHLIMDTDETGEAHSDTILSPWERLDLMGKIRAAATPVLFEDIELFFAEEPFDCRISKGGVIAPPPVRIMGRNGAPTVLDAGNPPTAKNLLDRARQRARAVVQNGFVVAHPLVPLVAVPSFFDEGRTKRLAAEIQATFRNCGREVTVQTVTFTKVEEIEAAATKLEATGAIVVLPESSSTPHGPNDTHEKVKRRLSISSQCLHHDHTQQQKTTSSSLAELQKSTDERTRRVATRIQQVYEICVSELLVKLGNVPFAPAAPFHYNVHIGLDVGGVHNNTVVVSLGYGFANPSRGLLFRCEKIDVPVSKVEPIPVEFLVRGLRDLFEAANAELSASGAKPDFDSVLVFRDGRMLGVDGRWNEIDAFRQVLAELQNAKVCSEKARWTAVEVSKKTQGLRLFALTPTPDNVLVGTWRQLDESDANSAIVVTTGRPYLSQGTASPTKATALPIAGDLDLLKVLRDYVWDADLSFTKPDMSLALPWTLHIADQSALDYSRTYRVPGITA